MKVDHYPLSLTFYQIFSKINRNGYEFNIKRKYKFERLFSTMRWLFISLIRFYQKFISPLKPPTCRFYPTCSHYGLEAVQRYGPIKGGYLTIVRILKCHPFHPGGFDPVPDLRQKCTHSKSKSPLTESENNKETKIQ